jgi:hypothetical protein
VSAIAPWRVGVKAMAGKGKRYIEAIVDLHRIHSVASRQHVKMYERGQLHWRAEGPDFVAKVKPRIT